MSDASAEPSLLERQILVEIQGIERRIADLANERSALERTLVRVRLAAPKQNDSTRINSVERILSERSILEALKSHKGPVRTKVLFQHARRYKQDLKEGTFRSYLHRLKNRGVIEPLPGNRGTWRLKEPAA